MWPASSRRLSSFQAGSVLWKTTRRVGGAVPTDAEPVAVGRLGPELRVQALGDERVRPLVERLLNQDGGAGVCEPAAHLPRLSVGVPYRVHALGRVVAASQHGARNKPASLATRCSRLPGARESSKPGDPRPSMPPDTAAINAANRRRTPPFAVQANAPSSAVGRSLRTRRESASPLVGRPTLHRHRIAGRRQSRQLPGLRSRVTGVARRQLAQSARLWTSTTLASRPLRQRARRNRRGVAWMGVGLRRGG